MIQSPWFPFFYQFIIGGALFFLGIVLALRKKAISTGNRRERRTLVQLVAGYIAFFLLYVLLIIAAGV